MKYAYIYLLGVGYVVFRHFSDLTVPIERIAAAHRVATFVSQEEAADYCNYRNDLMAKHGTDELPPAGEKL